MWLFRVFLVIVLSANFAVLYSCDPSAICCRCNRTDLQCGIPGTNIAFVNQTGWSPSQFDFAWVRGSTMIPQSALIWWAFVAYDPTKPSSLPSFQIRLKGETGWSPPLTPQDCFVYTLRRPCYPNCLGAPPSFEIYQSTVPTPTIVPYTPGAPALLVRPKAPTNADIIEAATKEPGKLITTVKPAAKEE